MDEAGVSHAGDFEHFWYVFIYAFLLLNDLKERKLVGLDRWEGKACVTGCHISLGPCADGELAGDDISRKKISLPCLLNTPDN